MYRTRAQLRRSLSKYTPDSIKRIKRSVMSGLHELNRPIHGYLYKTYPKVLQTSIPKSGTHLLNQVLEKTGYRLYKNQPFNPYIVIDYEPNGILPHLSHVLPGEYFIEHLAWHEDTERILLDARFKVVFIYRDPRATAVSWCHHMAKEGLRYPLHEHYKRLPNLKERIAATLEGIPDHYSTNMIGMCPWPDLYDHFLPWRKSSAVFSISFEDLIGSRGGGSDETQLSKIEGILKYLGCRHNHESACRLAKQIYNPSVGTFRTGQFDAWRAEIDELTEALLNEKLARQLAEWGYKE